MVPLPAMTVEKKDVRMQRESGAVLRKIPRRLNFIQATYYMDYIKVSRSIAERKNDLVTSRDEFSNSAHPC